VEEQSANTLRQINTLQWIDVEECARSAFNIWVDQPELNWAKEAWEHLVRQGLAGHSTELEKCQVKIRFLALAGIYHDWCCVVWQEAVPPMYCYWAEPLEISAFRMGQLVGVGSAGINEEPDDHNLFGRGLHEAIRASRPEVFIALLRGYGDISDLFVSLWNSDKVDSDEDEWEGDLEYADRKESAYQILNYDISEKGPAYTWLDQGAYELLNPY
jgi:hypothetical protein